MKDLWNSSFQPMLLDEIEKPFDSDDYIFEMKYDGIRCLLYASNDGVKLFNRHEIEITNLYPELQDIKTKKDVIFDGEIICMDDNLPSFSKLQKRAHLKDLKKINLQKENNPVIFICFDIIYENKDLTSLPLLKRKELLSKYADTDFFIKTKYIKTDGIKLFKTIKKNNIEGIVAKKIDSKYLINTRSKDWIKIKNFREETFIIGGYTFKEESFVFSVALGEYINKKFVFVGKVFISKKNKLFNDLKKSKKEKSNFENFDNDEYIFVNPTIEIKVKYIERTKNNNLRQPFYDLKGNNDEIR